MGSDDGRPQRHRRVPPTVSTLVAVLACFIVAHYVLLPQIAGVHESIAVVRRVNPWLGAAAIAVELASLVAYAQLARRLLPVGFAPTLGEMLRVQVATLGMSHVVPGGTAAATPLGYRLLQRVGVSAPDASFVLGAQSIASAAVLDLILLTALVASIPERGVDTAYGGAALVGALVTGVFAAVVFALSRGSTRTALCVRAVAHRLPFVDEDAVVRFLGEVVERFRTLASDRRRLLGACGWAGLQWVADASSLWVFLAAVGVRVPIDALLIAFGLANVSAAIPFTPGGLGVYEAVLTSSLVGFGVPHAEAIIGVLAYRLVEFWLPIPLGVVAYASVRVGPDVVAGARATAPDIDGVQAAYVATARVADGPVAWARRHGLRLGGGVSGG